jgi:hypothetical protein
MTESHKKRPIHRMAAIALLLLFSAGQACRGADVADTASSPTKGYNCLFLGHSFFAPIVNNLSDHPARCGFPKHKQTVVFHGGSKGAPGMLWASPLPDVAQAKKLLESGTVDLLGLTFYPYVGSEVSDYRKWIDLALKHNSKTRFIIQSPWAIYENKTLAQYTDDSEKSLKQIHLIIDSLRQAYPGNTILCIPQGRWMAGLWRLYSGGELPEVAILKRNNPSDKDPCLFLDHIGHGGDIPVKMGALLWLATIYQVDLNTYPWKTNTRYDLKKLAQEIIRNDPYCGLGSPNATPPISPPSAPATGSINGSHPNF